MATVITYGTFDLFHVGHLRLLNRLKAMGDKLIVAVSTDEFNQSKGKSAFLPYDQRSEIVSAIKSVDLVIPEESWEQKRSDIERYNVDVFGIGDDWAGKFDYLKDCCSVVYMSRTSDISSTSLRRLSRVFDDDIVNKLNDARQIINDLVREFDRP